MAATWLKKWSKDPVLRAALYFCLYEEWFTGFTHVLASVLMFLSSILMLKCYIFIVSNARESAYLIS